MKAPVPQIPYSRMRELICCMWAAYRKRDPRAKALPPTPTLAQLKCALCTLWTEMLRLRGNGVPAVNSLPPTITGGPAAGATLTRVDGTWSTGTVVRREWIRNGVPTGIYSTTYANTKAGDKIEVREYANPGWVSKDSTVLTIT